MDSSRTLCDAKGDAQQIDINLSIIRAGVCSGGEGELEGNGSPPAVISMLEHAAEVGTKTSWLPVAGEACGGEAGSQTTLRGCGNTQPPNLFLHGGRI